MTSNRHSATKRVVVLAAMVAVEAFSANVFADHRAFIGRPSDAVKQEEVQAAAVYPQEGATSGQKAFEMRLVPPAPPTLATTQQKHDAVVSAAVYPQAGTVSGRQSVKNRADAFMPPPLSTMRDKQAAVGAMTKANAGS